jgi:hypothetical protein
MSSKDHQEHDVFWRLVSDAPPLSLWRALSLGLLCDRGDRAFYNALGARNKHCSKH